MVMVMVIVVGRIMLIMVDSQSVIYERGKQHLSEVSDRVYKMSAPIPARARSRRGVMSGPDVTASWADHRRWTPGCRRRRDSLTRLYGQHEGGTPAQSD